MSTIMVAVMVTNGWQMDEGMITTTRMMMLVMVCQEGLVMVPSKENAMDGNDALPGAPHVHAFGTPGLSSPHLRNLSSGQGSG